LRSSFRLTPPTLNGTPRQVRIESYPQCFGATATRGRRIMAHSRTLLRFTLRLLCDYTVACPWLPFHQSGISTISLDAWIPSRWDTRFLAVIPSGGCLASAHSPNRALYEPTLCKPVWSVLTQLRSTVHHISNRPRPRQPGLARAPLSCAPFRPGAMLQ